VNQIASLFSSGMVANIVPKPMGFGGGGVWVMGYWGFMGYGVQIPVHQLGGSKKLWDIRGYGLPKAWVTRESTVILGTCQRFDPVDICVH
jgi:hypothetical protein